MPFALSPKGRPVWTWIIALLLALLLASAIVWRPTREVQPLTETNSRRQATTVVAQCATCHQEIVDVMQSAPHLNTLTWAAAPDVLRQFAGQSFEDEQSQATFEFFEQDERLWCRSTAFDQPVRLDWLFGSGSHARTPIALTRDASGEYRMLQHRISWYPEFGLSLTLGADETAPNASPTGVPSAGPRERIGLEFHGDWQSAAETIACFRCHSSRMNTDALNDPTGVQVGLGCTRCHVNAESHAARQEGGDNSGPAMVGWSSLSAREHINRCGECHRRADQTPADEITTEANHIVRFASVGLVQSKCFTATESSERMRLDCLTCHDPHRPAQRALEFYAEKCLTCHGRSEVVECSREPQSKACTQCHMPKRETQPHLSFTDHWIRTLPEQLTKPAVQRRDLD